jgi:hypothetical protein
MKMKRFAILVLWCQLLTLTLFCSKKDTEYPTFKLEEVSAFKVVKQVEDFVRGQLATTSNEPNPDVKTYPAFKSEKPIYGTVQFAKSMSDSHPGFMYHFAVDELAGSGKGYDRLYFDLNRDLDLTNDGWLSPQKKPPDGALLNAPWAKTEICFEYLYVNFDFGPTGKRPVEIMPRLMLYDEGHSVVTFVATKARKGEIVIAGQNYVALLGHSYIIDGRFDKDSTALYLLEKDNPRFIDGWWGRDQLNAIRGFGGTFYRFSTTPRGDQLVLRPYTGDFGVFKVGSGGRDIQGEFKMSGSLRSKDANVAVGDKIEQGWPKEAESCRIPVGDYLPSYLSLSFGPLSVTVSDNYHSDGKPRDRGERPLVYGITIRKDKPYVFDFSNSPDVLFASPARDRRIRAGEELKVAALLIDPELDIMIRGLQDNRRQHKREQVLPDGTKHTWEESVSLDPKVFVTRLDGKIVAEGVMPFG